MKSNRETERGKQRKEKKTEVELQHNTKITTP